MQTVQVKDVMVPIEDYATVSENAMLYDAVLALEKAQAAFFKSPYHHRAILVYDAHKKIVGKITQMDLLTALEPKYNKMVDVDVLSRTGYSMDYIKSFTGFWKKPLDDICRKAATLEVKNFMYTPKDGEFISDDAELNQAVHRLIQGRHQSLLVTRGNDIVGILRLSDVFKLVCEKIKACKI
ncbi:MAG: CBS domain-containing protein [Desulfobacteraceae bacterium]